MTGTWSTHRIGDLADIVHGFAFKGEYFREAYTGYLVLTPGNFCIGGGFQLGKPKFYDGPIPTEYVLSPGDLLVTMTDLSKGVDTLGYPAIVPEWDGIQMLHNQRLGLVRIRNTDAVDKRFLYYVLCTPAYRAEVLAGATGTTVHHTSPRRIAAFKFELPPVDEQRAIARILGALDVKIESNRALNETLEATCQVLFRSWFVDFDPVVAKSEGRRPPHLTDEVMALFPDRFDGSQLGPVPAGWRLSTIGEEVRVVGGSTPSTTVSEYWDDGVHHWITPKDLSLRPLPVVLETSRKITDGGLAKISSGLLPRGTVLLSSRAPIGYLAIAEVPLAVNQGFIAMVCEGALTSHFVVQWCAENMDEIMARAGGTTFAEISKANFRPIPVAVPNGAVLAAFQAVAEPGYATIRAGLEENAVLASLRDALLPRLLSGELRVRQAEQLIEEAV